VIATDLNILSKILTPASFKKIIFEDDKNFFTKRIKKYRGELDIANHITNRDVINKLYTFLTNHYRLEFLYKNILFNKLLEDKKLSGTTVLNELRIGNSIADSVFINGEPVLYEIKTELDTPQKLSSQLNDYQKAFPKIFIVTHESNYYRYYQIIKNTKVGLIYLSKDNQLITHKLAENSLDELDHTVLFKLMRKKEYSSLITKISGVLPDVPNTLFFKTCLEFSKAVSIQIFYKLVFEELKCRKAVNGEYISHDNTPAELRYICYHLNFDETAYQKLHRFLQSPFKS
jgi:hypothetical protein